MEMLLLETIDLGETTVDLVIQAEMRNIRPLMDFPQRRKKTFHAAQQTFVLPPHAYFHIHSLAVNFVAEQ